VIGGPVFFDLDETLLDDTGAKRAYLPQLFVAWRDRLPHASELEFDDAWRTALDLHFERHLRGELTFVEHRRERMRDVFRARLSDEACDALMQEFLRIYEANWRLFDDVLPALDALRHRPLGIITNGLEQQQRQKLEQLGILDRFAVVVTSDATKLSKPDAGIFHYAAQAIGARPEACVHVGDDWKKDVEGALAAGVRPIWLVRGAAPFDERSRRLSNRPYVARIKSLLSLVGRL
jgi:putative hydrolase of the HAD superfamily